MKTEATFRSEIATDIWTTLHEPKRGLVQRVVNTIGPEAAFDLLTETLAIEDAGCLR